MPAQKELGRPPCLTVIMFAGFLLLILLTGGNTSSSEQHLPKDSNAFNQSSEETSGGNSSSFEVPETYNDSQKFNQSINESSGGETPTPDPTPDVTKHLENFDEKLEPEKKLCGHQDVLNYLNLTSNNDLFTMSRPVKNHGSITYVYFKMIIAAILDVRETEQTLISHIWTYMTWNNDHIDWDPNKFCGLRSIVIPTKVLWKPDIMIEEMIEKEKGPPSPYLKINSYGEVIFKNDQVVISTCKIGVYQFPFDIQKCKLSFKSLMYSDKALYFHFYKNTTVLTQWSRKVMQTQYEWLFIKLNVTEETNNFSIGLNQTSIIYTVTMKRRSVLYIANFLLPILFFLCLDLSSFLISDNGGEKLSFKVTVMLAVTLMQLILKDILPSSSDRIPLIAVFCIGIFSLMMLSLLETILMMYLMQKDEQKLKEDKQGKYCFYNCCRAKKKYSNCASVKDVSTDQTSSVAKEGSSSQLTQVSIALEKVSDELEQIEQTMSALSCSNDEPRPDYWTRVANNINRVFITLYFLAVTVFLIVIFILWNTVD